MDDKNSFYREQIITIAELELGNTDPTKYLEKVGLPGNAHKLSWCGIFALYCYRTAEVCDFDWKIGSGYCFRLTSTKTPKVGDTAYFSKYSHHALVKSVNEDGTVTLINGNYGFPGHVALSTVKMTDVYTFFSIDKWLDLLPKE